MPKKSTRSGAQRNRARQQKNVQLVRQADSAKPENERADVESAEAEESAVATTTATTATTSRAEAATTRRRRATRTVEVTEPAEEVAEVEEVVIPVPKPAASSTSSRLVARRQAAQKTQQRPAPALITTEHYAYVRRDLIFIAILAIIMFSALIVLYFVPGIGS